MGAATETGGSPAARPTFLVAGAARAGTTGLIEGLRTHPRVFVTTPKEPHYFAMHGTRPDYRGPGDELSINRTAITRKLDYLGLYPRDSNHVAYGEGSVSTLYYHERALPEMLRMNPEMRVVVLLREPVARAYSGYQYLRAQGREPADDFLTALELEPARRAENWHHLWHYAAMSRYADAVRALRDHLAPGRVGVWFHDELERDYAGTLAEVVRFLELPADQTVGVDVPRVNISGVPRFQPLQHAISWASGRPALRQTARMVTTWQFREAVRSRLIRRTGPPPQVTAAVAPRFDDDLRALDDLLSDGDLLVGDRALPPWVTSRRRTRAR